MAKLICIWKKKNKDDDNFGKTYFWEVKPASYSVLPKKTMAETQLQGYVNTDKDKYLIGGSLIESGEFSYRMYNVSYENIGNGLIVYWFKRRPNEEEYKPQENENPVTWGSRKKATKEVIEHTQEITEKEQQRQQQQDNSSSESRFIDGAIVVGGIVIVSAATIAAYRKMAEIQIAINLPNVDKTSHSETVVIISQEFLLALAEAKTTKNAVVLLAAIGPLTDLFGEINISAEAEELEEAMLEGNEEKIDELTTKIQDNAKKYKDAAKAQPPRDPLIIDLGKQGIELTTLDNGVNFDMDNNTFAEKTAWIGLEDGFLVLDRNDNGKIDNGGELFGDQVILKSGLKSTSGFEALMEFDENKDGIIDKKDIIYSSLKVWIDENHNGISETNELKILTELSISSINLKITQEGKIDTVTGTREASSSEVVFTNGTKRKISEFWFPVDLSNTTQDGNATSGNVPTIGKAIEADETGELFGLWIKFNVETNITLKRFYSKQILYFITGASDIDVNSRGGNVDARDLKVIEQFMGTTFKGISGENPNAQAAEILKDIYTNIENQYFNILNLQSGFGGYLNSVYEYVDENGKKSLDLSFLNYIIESKISDGENVDTLVYDLGVYLKSFDTMNGTKVFDEYSEVYSQISNHYAKIVELSKSGNTFIGTDGNDKFNGTVNNDFIFGGTGDDILNSGGGNDTFVFGLNHGNDVVIGGKGTNTLVFENGINFIDYTTGTNANMDLVLINKETSEKICIQNFISNPAAYDFIFDGKSSIIGGGTATETINGTDKDDELVRSLGFNTFYGGNGNDTIRGGDHIDIIYGEEGNDKLYGGNSTNFIFGGLGNEEINDGDNSSYLCGGDGDDKIYAGGGNDVLDGGKGNDYLQGDHDDDIYIYKKDYGTDVISDSAGKNTIKISGLSSKNIKVGKTSRCEEKKTDESDAVIKFDGSNEFLIIKGYFYTNNAEYEFIFDDGTKITNKISSYIDMKSGDLNLDGKVDNLDLVVLCQYLIKTFIISNEIVPYADLNRDGVFDVADLAILKQYLMGDNVNIG